MWTTVCTDCTAIVWVLNPKPTISVPLYIMELSHIPMASQAHWIWQCLLASWWRCCHCPDEDVWQTSHIHPSYPGRSVADITDYATPSRIKNLTWASFFSKIPLNMSPEQQPKCFIVLVSKGKIVVGFLLDFLLYVCSTENLNNWSVCDIRLTFHQMFKGSVIWGTIQIFFLSLFYSYK